MAQCKRWLQWFVASAFWLTLGGFIYYHYFDSLQAWNWWGVDRLAKKLRLRRFTYAWPDGCSNKQSIDARSSNSTGLKVILAGMSKTGTSSLAQAMRDLGLRTYHIEEKTTYAKSLNYDEVDPRVFARRASRCRLEALSLEPHTDQLYTAMVVSPGVKVILTVRDFPSWKASAKKARGTTGKDIWWPPLYNRWQSCFRFFPWLHVWDYFTGQFSRHLREGVEIAGAGQGSASTYMLHKMLSEYDSPLMKTFTRGVFRVRPIMDYMAEENFLALHNEIRTIVPKEDLLELDVRKHGWKEVNEFLGYPMKPGQDKMPHTRNVHGWTNDAVIDNNPDVAFQVFATFCSLHFIHAAVIGWLLRATLLAVYGLFLLIGDIAKKAREFAMERQATKTKSS